MKKRVYLYDDNTIAYSEYCSENKEELDFMKKYPLNDGTGYKPISKEETKKIIKMYEEKFTINIIIAGRARKWTKRP